MSCVVKLNLSQTSHLKRIRSRVWIWSKCSTEDIKKTGRQKHTMFLHDHKELNDHFWGRPDHHLPLARLLSIVHALKSVIQNADSHHPHKINMLQKQAPTIDKIIITVKRWKQHMDSSWAQKQHKCLCTILYKP